ncbi:MAG: pilus assembly protein TadG-related protein [Desulfobaccales bacterium]
MDRRKSSLGRLGRETDGTVAIMAALGLLAFLGIASLAIDTGQLYYARNQLQNAADSAALAAAGNLIKDAGGGVAERDANAASQAAMTVAQRQSQLSGLPALDSNARTDLTLTFGEWNVNAGNPQTAWTEVGSTCSSSSTANAVKVQLRRAAGLAYGPVTNIFASVFGVKTSEVAASAIAYLGYTTSVGTGTVQVPLALPSSILTASSGHSGWFARLLGPREAVAATKTLTFKDTGGSQVTSSVPTSPAAGLDSSQGYFYTVGPSDSVPNTIKDILKKVYTPSYTSQNPVVVASLKVGQQIYPRSEYPWGRSYIGAIFQNLKQAYNYKKDGSGKWHTTLAVFGPKTVASLPMKTGFMSLARLLTPFWPSEAFACTTMNPPTIMVTGFVNVDIIGVTANNTTCDDCTSYRPANNGITYSSKKDCLTNKPDSAWNANTVTVENVTDASTVTPTGSLSGGPSNKTINPGAPSEVGALAAIPRLVK